MSWHVYPPEVVERIARLCEAEPERESCGFVVCEGAALEVVPVANVAERYHSADPERFPRNARSSYLMDPKDQLRLWKRLSESGGEVLAVWHSHIEVGAYFSEKDRADAVIGGEQALPGAEYLVFSVRSGKVDEAKCYRYRDGRFEEAEARLVGESRTTSPTWSA